MLLKNEINITSDMKDIKEVCIKHMKRIHVLRHSIKFLIQFCVLSAGAAKPISPALHAHNISNYQNIVIS